MVVVLMMTTTHLLSISTHILYSFYQSLQSEAIAFTRPGDSVPRITCSTAEWEPLELFQRGPVPPLSVA